MKTELKISTLSIVCALCTMAFGAANAAAPVRALGGAGTYSSASSAASAKATTAKPAASKTTTAKASGATSTRAGVMRVLPTASTANKNASTSTSSGGTVVSGTRASATPRLSIGKYLPNRVVNKPTVDTANKDDLDSLTGRVQTLEDAVFDSANGLEAQLKSLQDQVAAGETELDDELATIDSTFETVNADIDAIEKNIADLSGDFDAEKAAMATTVAGIRTSIEELKASSGTDFTTVKADITKLQTDLGALTGRVSALETGKQNVLSNSKYISVVNDTVELNLDVLRADIDTYIGTGVIIDYDTTTNTMEWTVPGTSTEYVKFGDIFVDPSELKVAEDKIVAMVNGIGDRVTALESGVRALQGTVGTGEMTVGDTVVSTIIDAVNALDKRADNIASASGAENEALAGRVTTLETDVNSQTTGLVITHEIATANRDSIEDENAGLAAAHSLINELDAMAAETDEIARAAIPNVSDVASDGKYVLTADVAGNTTTYKWEPIDRGLLGE